MCWMVDICVQASGLGELNNQQYDSVTVLAG